MITTNQYIKALNHAQLSANQWRTLRAIYNEPGHACSPTKLARLLGYSDVVAANGAFGVTARTIGEYLGKTHKEGDDWFSIVAYWNPQSKEWVLIGEFVTALMVVGIEQKATGDTATTAKDVIKPTKRSLLIDLVKDAGVDVSDWKSGKGGAKKAASNPKYCYEWSFVQPNKVVVLNLWHDNISVGADGSLRTFIDIRSFASQRPSPEKERALKVDDAIQTAIRDELPIRVIVLEGKRRTKDNSEPSLVSKRLLDPVTWGVVKYNWDNGDCVLVRGSDHSPDVKEKAQSDEGESGNWTREELKASVEAYLDLKQKMQAGEQVNKKQLYRDLSERFGRSEKAYEYRMQNISYVLSLSGRDWVSGLLPASNVGANVAAQIETLIAEIENRPIKPSVKFEAQVQANRKKKNLPKPSGAKEPQWVVGQTTQYVRDPEVKAWVLQESKGKCECCSKPAPFLTGEGLPFLEVHHVRQLADKGPDIVENAVALCPNCHREIHHGANGKKLVEHLYTTVKRLVKPEAAP